MTRAMTLALALAVAAPRAAQADAGKKIVELSERGQQLWTRSCKGAYIGACVKRVQVKGRQTDHTGRCSSGWALRAKRRNKARAKKAQKLFARALALYKTVGGEAPAGVQEAAAAARFHQADAVFEAHVRLLFPSKLDFGSKNKKRARRSQKAFGEYLQRKAKSLSDARTAYANVITFKSSRWAVAAAARIGQMFDHFAAELTQAPIPSPPVPSSLTEPDAVENFRKMFADTYCDTLASKAGPLAKKAQESYEVCVRHSKGKSVLSDFADYCKDRLKKGKP